jgi:hypothetical protein
MTKGGVAPGGTELDADLRARLTALYEEGRQIARRFAATSRQRGWHPFVAADYDRVERVLLPLRQPGLRFLEWGSATGVITIMADLLGFEACGIEIDPELVALARNLARRFDSGARFATGSFLPAGYEWASETGDRRLGTIGEGVPGYQELQRPLEDFDLVYGYPWSGEEPVMRDVMLRCGGPRARLLLHGAQTVQVAGWSASGRRPLPL